MPVPDLTADDIVAAYQRLLPRGRIWSHDPDSVQARVLGLLAPTYVRQTQRQNALLVDAFPSTTSELLPEWEATLGLPDPCTPLAPTLAQRKSAVLAKFIAAGGQSKPYIVAVAAALGWPGVTITEYAPFRAGISRAGDPAMDATWAFGFRINVPAAVDVQYFKAGGSVAGDPVARWGDAELQCRLSRLAPAHTIPTFAYV
jgi:uncharacterized protein YmfQ (DUF2313 family)